jgi:sarcosine/dimethylglycine N-methyltransferase
METPMDDAVTAQGRKVAAHWSRLAVTYEGALAALAEAGIEKTAVQPEDLHALDMIHMGGLSATDALAEQASITPGLRVIDVGAGVGGPARRFADKYGAVVTAVELSETLADTAERLTHLVGLSSNVHVLNTSALALPVEDASYDVVVMQHVAMQIAEKDRLFGELARVLAPGGRLALHEIFAGDGELQWPLAWATEPSMSALETLDAAIRRLNGLGLATSPFVDESESGRRFHENIIKRWGRAADAGQSADGLSPEVLEQRVAASRSMEYNLRVGSLKVGRLLATRPN